MAAIFRKSGQALCTRPDGIRSALRVAMILALLFASCHYQILPTPALPEDTVRPLASLTAKRVQCGPGEKVTSAYSGPLTLSLHNDGDQLRYLAKQVNESLAELFLPPPSMTAPGDLDAFIDSLNREDVRRAGASALLLEHEFGPEIDSHEAVFRMNGSPLEGYQRWTGARTTYDVINESAMASLAREAGNKRAVTTGPADCPQHFIRYELLQKKKLTLFTILTMNELEVLAREQQPPFGGQNGTFTSSTDPAFVVQWLLSHDKRLKSTFVTSYARLAQLYKSKAPCPQPRVLHPAFDVFTKQFAGLPQQTDYSTGIWGILLAASMCETVTLYGFGGPLGASSSWPHYYAGGNTAPDWHDQGLRALARFRDELNGADMPHLAAGAQHRAERKDGKIIAVTVTMGGYHPVAQERALVAMWTGSDLYDVYTVGRQQLDMSQFYRCVPEGNT